jgi:hypothetical protein
MPCLVRADRLAWLVALAAPCALLAGCGPANDDGIKTYIVATSKSGGGGGGGPVGPPPPGDQTPKVRFLGGIIPTTEGRSYFVRFLGPIEQVDPLEKDFDAFLNSIRVPGEGGKPITWTVPAGWKEIPNPPEAAGLRTVTIKKADDKSPDLYISTPITGDLLVNVNRWRTDFVGIPRITQAELPTVAKEIQLGPTKAHRVDLRGPGGKGGKGRPPFAGGG